MDAGMDPPELEGEKILTFAKYLENGDIKIEDFTIEEKIGIMDELLANEVRFL